MNSKLFPIMVLTWISSFAHSPAAAQDTPRSETFSPGAKCLTAENEAAAKSDAITKEQADAIVGELKQIRQLLEKQQVQLARAMVSRTAPAPAPPAKRQMYTCPGWSALVRGGAPGTTVEFS